MIYILVFALSLICFIFAEKCKKRNKTIFYIFTLIAILIPCLLAAFRATTIGTDVKLYIENWFSYANKASSFKQYLNYISSTEILYLFINYVISIFTNKISVLFFVLQLLTILPLVIALNRSDNKISVPLAMLIYFLFFYNMSFNAVRQSISISFVILGITYLLDNKKKTFLIFLIIGILFHSSATLVIPLYFIYISSKSKKVNLYTLLYLLIIIFILLNFESIVLFLLKIGILPSKYINYVTTYLRTDLDFSLVNNIFYFSLLILMGLFIDKKDKNNKFLFILFILGIAIFESGMISKFANRASYYFLFPGIFLLLPQLCNPNYKITKNRMGLTLLIIFIFVVYWVFWIVFQNVHETFPYVFS